MSKNQTISLNQEQLQVLDSCCGEGKKYPSKYAFCKEAVVEKIKTEKEIEKENERERKLEGRTEENSERGDTKDKPPFI